MSKPSAPDSAIDLSHDDNVFFDFEPQSTTVSAASFSPPGVTSMPGWGSDINFSPVTPPGSISFSPPKEWSSNFPLTFSTPGNILTDIHPNSFRAQYGQVTPPDDDNDSLFDHQLREQQEQHSQLQTEQSASPSKKRKRIDTSLKENPATSPQTPAKRTRKYASRNAKPHPPDPNNPAEVRRSKFLERNRVAASKCRQKKKEWTQNLETRARDLQKNNSSLRIMVESLREEVLFLKGECKKHIGCECHDIQQFMDDAAPKVHASHLLVEKEAGSPINSAPHSRLGSIDYASTLGSEGANATELADDDNVLEALLTNSMEQDATRQRGGGGESE